MCSVLHQFTRDSQHWTRDSRSASQILEEDWQAHKVHASAFGRPMVTLSEWDSENTAYTYATIKSKCHHDVSGTESGVKCTKTNIVA